MNEELVLVNISTLACLLVSRFTMGYWASTVSISALWWLLWTTLANLGPTGLESPSTTTTAAVALLIGAAAAGCLFNSLAVVGMSPERGSTNTSEWYTLPKKLVPVQAVLISFITIFAVKSVPLIMSGATTSEYRNLVLGSADEASLIFNSTVSYVFYTSVFSPLAFGCVILGLALHWAHGEWRFFALAMLTVLLDQIVNLGRFGLYYVAILSIGAALFTRRLHPNSAEIKKRSLRLVILASLGIVVLLFVSLLRLQDDSNFSDVFSQFIEYHTVGLLLFDIDLSRAGSMLNSSLGLGRASLGGLEEYVALVLKRFDSTIQPVRHTIGTYQNIFQYTGVRHDGTVLFYNAYFTSLFTLYYDGGWLGIALGGFLFGVFCCRQEIQYSVYKRGDNLMRVILALYLGIFSIFVCPLMTSKFWIALILSYIWAVGARVAGRDVK